MTARRQTRFGAVWTDLRHCAALLRAIASHDGPLVTVTPEVLAACVVATESWMLATGTSRLSLDGVGDDAAAALAGILSRLRGVEGVAPTFTGTIPARAKEMNECAAMVERVTAWDLDVNVVFSEAARLLARGDSDRRIAAVIAALDAHHSPA